MAGSTIMLDPAGSAPLRALDGRPDGAKGAKRPLPHIQDIVSVTVDVSPHTPVDKALQMAEVYLRQAESSKNFGRPDFALKDYIRASILLDSIKGNKGWVSLQRDNKAQLERYQRLLRQALAAHGDFEAIKAEIKADNARTGVQPTVSRPVSAGDGEGGRSEKTGAGGQQAGDRVNGAQAKENGVSDKPAPPTPKAKPIVHPKPPSLQGNSLAPGAAAAPSAKAQDLVQRFANLRTSTAKPAQDPRIRTQPIVPPDPQGPHKPPDAPLADPAPAGVIADLPRVPDAIYNPPRGTISSEAAELPSSSPRAMFTRTSSTTSLNTFRSARSAGAEEAFGHVRPSGPTNVPPKRAKPAVPDGDSISVEDLLRLMSVGAKTFKILLIDLRSREEFDDGHILSHATICIEPEVISRKDISANEIADSMVLAPKEEQLLFEKRHEFDLVVFYDQDSECIEEKPRTPRSQAVSSLYHALTQYDFAGAPGGLAPKLLRGGLDAWTRLAGSASLQSSSTSVAQKKQGTSPLVRSFLNPRQKHLMRPIQDPEEARRWEDTIADAGAISPIRTTEDFLRRFPPISAQRESMTCPVSPPTSRPQSPFHHRMSHEENLYTSLPSPPTRPPPALPRRNYSGLAEAEDGPVTSAKRSMLKGPIDTVRKTRTGLKNPGVFCFANSSLQAMFGTPGFAREVWTGEWKDRYKVPMKPDEKLENPQLLIKCLANLFHWLSQGTLGALEARTFMVRDLLPGRPQAVRLLTVRRSTSITSIQRQRTAKRNPSLRSLEVLPSKMLRNSTRSSWTISMTKPTSTATRRRPRKRSPTLRRTGASSRTPSTTGATTQRPAPPLWISTSAAWRCSSRAATTLVVAKRSACSSLATSGSSTLPA